MQTSLVTYHYIEFLVFTAPPAHGQNSFQGLQEQVIPSAHRQWLNVSAATTEDQEALGL